MGKKSVYLFLLCGSLLTVAEKSIAQSMPRFHVLALADKGGGHVERAMERYIKKGKGGWIGFHHPTLLGIFDGYPMWKWFSDFMGGIQFKAHIPGGTNALLHVEDSLHPAMLGLPQRFTTKDEWYIYDRSPRPHVHVLASIDEATYEPAKEVKMGDHPVIWTTNG